MYICSINITPYLMCLHLFHFIIISISSSMTMPHNVIKFALLLEPVSRVRLFGLQWREHCICTPWWGTSPLRFLHRDARSLKQKNTPVCLPLPPKITFSLSGQETLTPMAIMNQQQITLVKISIHQQANLFVYIFFNERVSCIYRCISTKAFRRI